jgi:hypothetical protein
MNKFKLINVSLNELNKVHDDVYDVDIEVQKIIERQMSLMPDFANLISVNQSIFSNLSDVIFSFCINYEAIDTGKDEDFETSRTIDEEANSYMGNDDLYK